MLYLVRYSEIGLKSRAVRGRMITLLKRNILDYLEKAGMAGSIRTDGGHLYLNTDEPADRILERTFGVHSFSRVETSSDKLEEISRLALDMTSKFKGPFRVRARRTGTHDYTSMDLASRIGADIVDAHGLAVNLTEPVEVLYVEVRGSQSYLYTEKVRGPGGFPLGSQRTLACLVDGARGLASAWMMMRRGCRISAFGCEEEVQPLIAWDPRIKRFDGGLDEIVELVEKGRYKGIVLGISSSEAGLLAGIPTGIPVYTPLMAHDDPSSIIDKVNDPPVL